MTPVSPSFLKQEAKKLKKKLGISTSESLDETAKKFGYQNYRHYLNVSEANLMKSISEKESLFKSITLESNLSRKMDLAVDYIQKFKIPFKEQLDVLEFFQRSQEILRTLCEKLTLKDEVQKFIQNYFLTEKSQKELQTYPMRENFVAKDLSVKSLTYRLEGNKLFIDGNYDLSFEFAEVVPDEYKNLPHFRRSSMFGDFEITIDYNKKITIDELSIGEDINGTIFMESFWPK